MTLYLWLDVLNYFFNQSRTWVNSPSTHETRVTKTVTRKSTIPNYIICTYAPLHSINMFGLKVHYKCFLVYKFITSDSWFTNALQELLALQIHCKCLSLHEYTASIFSLTNTLKVFIYLRVYYEWLTNALQIILGLEVHYKCFLVYKCIASVVCFTNTLQVFLGLQTH